MVWALSSFMEFCYLVRRSVIDFNDLGVIDAAVAKFHQDQSIFDGVRPNGYSLPRQHSLIHYTTLIREFGAPNGLCSSITELKHIKAVKEPWRRSNRFEALGQMLLTNQRIDKLNAARVDFRARGLLTRPLFLPPEPLLPTIPEQNEADEEDDDGGDIDGEVDSEVILVTRASGSFSFIKFLDLLIFAVILSPECPSLPCHVWRINWYPSPSLPHFSIPLRTRTSRRPQQP